MTCAGEARSLCDHQTIGGMRIALVTQDEHYVGWERSRPAFPACGRLGVQAAFRKVRPAMETKILLVLGHDGYALPRLKCSRRGPVASRNLLPSSVLRDGGYNRGGL